MVDQQQRTIDPPHRAPARVAHEMFTKLETNLSKAYDLSSRALDKALEANDPAKAARWLAIAESADRLADKIATIVG